MIHRVMLCCLCLLLESCATPQAAHPDVPVAPEAMAATPLVPGQSDLALNVPGGKYQQFAMPLGENDDGIVELTIDRVNENPQWGAVANLCVQADPESDQVCLRFQVVARESRQLAAKQVVVQGDGKALLASDDLPGDFHIGETIKLHMRVRPGSVEFRINDAVPIIKTLSFTSRRLTFGCSSALCRARVT